MQAIISREEWEDYLRLKAGYALEIKTARLEALKTMLDILQNGRAGPEHGRLRVVEVDFLINSVRKSIDELNKSS